MNPRSLLLPIIVLSLSLLSNCNKSSTNKINKHDLDDIAQEWTNAWNGKIDKDSMMSIYHPDMQYYWRGKPMDYKTFERVVENHIVPTSNYDIYLHDKMVTILDDDAAVVSFNWTDRNSTEPPASVSLTLKKERDSWKVIHVHESLVRPLPPDDFEEQFNQISKKYQDDYMNAHCDALLPMLDENLVIFENGEELTFERVKKFCNHLPFKPVFNTDRSYKILDDNTVYEFVSQMYKSKTGNKVNETQAMIWKYNDGVWKIVNYDISRYWIKNDE